MYVLNGGSHDGVPPSKWIQLIETRLIRGLASWPIAASFSMYEKRSGEVKIFGCQADGYQCPDNNIFKLIQLLLYIRFMSIGLERTLYCNLCTNWRKWITETGSNERLCVALLSGSLPRKTWAWSTIANHDRQSCYRTSRPS